MHNSKKLEEGNFVEDGYTIIRKAISPTLIDKTQKIINDSLNNLISNHKLEINIHKENDKNFYEKITKLIEKETPFDALVPAWQDLIRHKIFASIFSEKKIFEFISNILGKDLCHQDNPGLTLNLPGISDSKINYLFKGYHQEVWSGADTHTIQFWTPIFQSDKSGGIVLIKGSHLWGHIPHRNREPIELPKNITEIHSDLEIGDVIIFHTLLLHRSAPIKLGSRPRLAIPCVIKNFRMPNDSFERYINWKIFSYSDLSQIDRRLGNHYLSPFRLLDINKKQNFDGGIS
jgi:ectoine hydroxylase-related dioxygenase (phytanoyl-CoA dioxygenase family)